ncbi:hypothetical protein LIER_31443 [Lithospermum erythrorhizon]|uniref:Uncharacterized protein n=1 Tax=Lithospermum erythrorhizon TaxID=34254 RepID=A0AAV3RWY2_LITER
MLFYGILDMFNSIDFHLFVGAGSWWWPDLERETRARRGSLELKRLRRSCSAGASARSSELRSSRESRRNCIREAVGDLMIKSDLC